MRAASTVLFAVWAAISLSLANAESAADQASVHLRIGVQRDEQPAAVADDDGIPAALSSHKKSYHASPHLRELRSCLPVAKESFRNNIVSSCAVRSGGFDFYYQLTDGRIMVNCLCESYNRGVSDVNLGRSVVHELNVVCYTKKSGLSGADVKKIFNHKEITCDPFGF